MNIDIIYGKHEPDLLSQSLTGRASCRVALARLPGRAAITHVTGGKALPKEMTAQLAQAQAVAAELIGKLVEECAKGGNCAERRQADRGQSS